MILRGHQHGTGEKSMTVAQSAQHTLTNDIDLMELDRIIGEEYGNDKENLIMILQAIQRRYNYLPKAALTYLSAKLEVPFSKIYGVATFYSTFSLEPRGRHIISVCLGTACHVRGAERNHERIQEALCIADGQTTPDMRFTLESVRCIGCCSLGPVIKVDEDMHARIPTDKVVQILDSYE
jgi:NADH:ubiquinone oxidoreductase subunit E